MKKRIYRAAVSQRLRNTDLHNTSFIRITDKNSRFVNSGFRRGVNKIFTLLRCYAT